MTVGEFFAEIAEKAGLESTDARIKDLLSITTVVNDEFVTEARGQLMDLKTAKNNPAVANHFKSQLYGGIDQEIQKRLDSIDDEAWKEDFLKIANTPKKTQAILDKLLEEVSKPKTPAESKDLKDKINLLNTELLKYKEGYVPKEELDTLRSGFENERLDSIQNSAFLSRQWSENYALEYRNDLAKLALERKLNELNALKVRDGNSIKLVSKENPELELYVNNKIVTFDSLVDQIMVDNKFQAVSKPTTPQPQNPGAISQPNVRNPNPAVLAALNQAKAGQGMTF